MMHTIPHYFVVFFDTSYNLSAVTKLIFLSVFIWQIWILVCVFQLCVLSFNFVFKRNWCQAWLTSYISEIWKPELIYYSAVCCSFMNVFNWVLENEYPTGHVIYAKHFPNIFVLYSWAAVLFSRFFNLFEFYITLVSGINRVAGINEVSGNFAQNK